MENWKPEMGEVVWAHIRSHPWWPAMLFDPSKASRKARAKARPDHILIAFFGDNTFNWLRVSDLRPFSDCFIERASASSTQLFRTACAQALVQYDRLAEEFLTQSLRDSGHEELRELHASLVPTLSEYVQQLAKAPYQNILLGDVTEAASSRARLLAARSASAIAPPNVSLLDFLLNKPPAEGTGLEKEDAKTAEGDRSVRESSSSEDAVISDLLGKRKNRLEDHAFGEGLDELAEETGKGVDGTHSNSAQKSLGGKPRAQKRERGTPKKPSKEKPLKEKKAKEKPSHKKAKTSEALKESETAEKNTPSQAASEPDDLEAASPSPVTIDATLLTQGAVEKTGAGEETAGAGPSPAAEAIAEAGEVVKGESEEEGGAQGQEKLAGDAPVPAQAQGASETATAKKRKGKVWLKHLLGNVRRLARCPKSSWARKSENVEEFAEQIKRLREATYSWGHVAKKAKMEAQARAAEVKGVEEKEAKEELGDGHGPVKQEAAVVKEEKRNGTQGDEFETKPSVASALDAPAPASASASAPAPAAGAAALKKSRADKGAKRAKSDAPQAKEKQEKRKVKKKKAMAIATTLPPPVVVAAAAAENSASESEELSPVERPPGRAAEEPLSPSGRPSSPWAWSDEMPEKEKVYSRAERSKKEERAGAVAAAAAAPAAAAGPPVGGPPVSGTRMALEGRSSGGGRQFAQPATSAPPRGYHPEQEREGRGSQVLFMRFPDSLALPSEGQLKANFARYGPLLVEHMRVYRQSKTAQVAFRNPHDAAAAMRDVKANKTRPFGSAKVHFRLKELQAHDADRPQAGREAYQRQLEHAAKEREQFAGAPPRGTWQQQQQQQRPPGFGFGPAGPGQSLGGAVWRPPPAGAAAAPVQSQPMPPHYGPGLVVPPPLSRMGDAAAVAGPALGLPGAPAEQLLQPMPAGPSAGPASDVHGHSGFAPHLGAPAAGPLGAVPQPSLTPSPALPPGPLNLTGLGGLLASLSPAGTSAPAAAAAGGGGGADVGGDFLKLLEQVQTLVTKPT